VITIPLEDLVFVVCALIGGSLLLIMVVFDDILGGILDALHVGFDIGGTSVTPLLLGFISMFGVGGLFATQVLSLHGGSAATIGAVFGAAGAFLAWGLFGILRRSESPNPFSLQDLVGREASVAVAIPAGRLGSVYVKAEGQTHEVSATASVDVAPGTTVSITGVSGPGLVVAPRAPGGGTNAGS
jgi:membrane protein implicated in regulation of membrane protease activity